MNRSLTYKGSMYRVKLPIVIAYIAYIAYEASLKEH